MCRTTSVKPNGLSSDLPQQFAASMAQILPDASPKHLAVAVSGGSDSMALCLLLQEFCQTHGHCLTALTVDHALRPESAAEAEQVSSWLAAYKIPHHILRWQGEKPQSNIHDHARRARYDLMTEFCLRQNISHLFLAHHADDLVENFLIRLSRGSGLYGLSAMPEKTSRGGIVLARPLLDFSKAQLTDYLRACHQDWIEDPSNDNNRFTRARIRNNLHLLQQLQISPARILETARQLHRARKAIEHQCQIAYKNAATISPYGFAQLNLPLWRELPDEISLRLLSDILRDIGGGDYGPRLESLQDIWQSLMQNDFPQNRTLGGCLLQAQNDHLLIQREYATISDSIILNTESGAAFWDGRFRIHWNNLNPDFLSCHIHALGEAGWAEIVQKQPDLRKIDIPYATRCALPVIRRKAGGLDEILTVPHLNYWKDNHLQISGQAIDIQFHPQTKL